MKLFYNGFLYEAQELDKRNTYEYVVKKYLDRDNIYVTFHNVENISINPQSAWNTPNGIYAYSFSHFMNSGGDVEYKGTYYNEKGKVINLGTPAKYVSVITPKNISKGLNLSDVTEKYIKKSVSKIITKIYGIPNEDLTKAIIEYSEKMRYSNTLGGTFWTATLVLSILIYASVSNNRGVESEVLEVIRENKILLNGLVFIVGKYPTSIWINVLSLLDIEYVIDNGLKIIHSNEPNQVLFTKPSVIDVLDTVKYRGDKLIDNKDVIKSLMNKDKLDDIVGLIGKNKLALSELVTSVSHHSPYGHKIKNYQFSNNSVKIIEKVVSNISNESLTKLSPILLLNLSNHSKSIVDRIISNISNESNSFNNELREYIITEINNPSINDDDLFNELQGLLESNDNTEILDIVKPAIATILYGNKKHINMISDQIAMKIVNDLNMLEYVKTKILEKSKKK